MTHRLRKPSLVLAICVVMIGVLAGPASAAPPAENHQVRGVATFDTPRCELALDLKPDANGLGLDGCLVLMTVDDERLSRGGVLKEYGTERFTGDLIYMHNGEKVTASGTFDTTYVITSKWEGAPYASDQHHGRCQHPLTSGTGDFLGATGRVDFKDTIVDGVAVEFPFRGHIRLATG